MSPNFWKDKNVFVTGATGLMGTFLTAALAGLEAQVVVLIRDDVARSRLREEGIEPKVTVIHGQVEDYPLLERVLNEYEIDTVFHLAAQTIVGTALRSPVGTFKTNVEGTWNLLEACRRSPLVARILVASSDKAYGAQEVLPYKEDSPMQGMHPYDVSKSCADLIARAYHKSYGLNICVTRCANLYGPGDLNFNRLVPGTIRSILEGKAPVIRSDGRYIRDYLYVRDAAKAYMELGQRMVKKELAGEAFNFSASERHDVIGIVRKILRLMSREDLQPIVLNEVKHEITEQYLSAQKAHTLLQWKPDYTLEKGLRETIAWYESYFKSSPLKEMSSPRKRGSIQ